MKCTQLFALRFNYLPIWFNYLSLPHPRPLLWFFRFVLSSAQATLVWISEKAQSISALELLSCCPNNLLASVAHYRTWDGPELYINGSTFVSVIGPLQFTITWYKNRHAGEQTTHWDIQNKRILSKVALFWMSQGAVCSPAWRFSYHVIVNCKGPIRRPFAMWRLWFGCFKAGFH